MKRISNDEIKQTFLNHFAKQYGKEAAAQLLEGLPSFHYAKSIAQAQLGSCEKERKAEIRKLFKEMDYYERKPEQFDPLHPFLRTGDIYIIPAEYQALKERWIK